MARWMMKALLVGKYPSNVNDVGLLEVRQMAYMAKGLKSLVEKGASPSDIVNAFVQYEAMSSLQRKVQ
jgi:hypothetical protein